MGAEIEQSMSIPLSIPSLLFVHGTRSDNAAEFSCIIHASLYPCCESVELLHLSFFFGPWGLSCLIMGMALSSKLWSEERDSFLGKIHIRMGMYDY